MATQEVKDSEAGLPPPAVGPEPIDTGGQPEFSEPRPPTRTRPGLAVIAAFVLFLTTSQISAYVFMDPVSVMGVIFTVVVMLLLVLGTMFARSASIPMLPIYLSFAMMALIGGAVVVVDIIGDAEIDTSVFLLATIVSTLVVIGAFAVALNRSPIDSPVWKVPAKWRRALLIVPAIWLITAFSSGLIISLAEILGLDFLVPSQSFEEIYGEIEGPFAVAVLVFAIALYAPLVEEFVFRGILLRYLQRYLPVAVAVLGSSVLFTLIHLFPELYLSIFLLSVGISVAYLLYGIWGAIGVHFLQNSFALIVAAFEALTS